MPVANSIFDLTAMIFFFVSVFILKDVLDIKFTYSYNGLYSLYVFLHCFYAVDYGGFNLFKDSEATAGTFDDASLSYFLTIKD